MIFLKHSQTFLEANTYILADDDTGIALVVDTGAGSAQWIKDALSERDLELGAILLTHGHADHVWDVSLVAGDVPVYIPEPDLYRMDNPVTVGRSEQYLLALSRMGVGEWAKPNNLQTLPSDMLSSGYEIVPGIRMRAVPAPGHTEGSTVFLFEGEITEDANQVMEPTGRREAFMISGDVLFNNGVGRTDLAGGDEQKMASSLRLLVQIIKPETYVFPGHGPHTTMFHETRHSPYLHAAMS